MILRVLDLFNKKDRMHSRGAVNCLLHLIDKLPAKYFLAHYIDILHMIFVGIQKIPEVIKLNMFDDFKLFLVKLAKLQASHCVQGNGQSLSPGTTQLQHQLLINISELMGNLFCYNSICN